MLAARAVGAPRRVGRQPRRLESLAFFSGMNHGRYTRVAVGRDNRIRVNVRKNRLCTKKRSATKNRLHGADPRPRAAGRRAGERAEGACARSSGTAARSPCSRACPTAASCSCGSSASPWSRRCSRSWPATARPDEDPEACARRELREETGYAARTIRPLGLHLSVARLRGREDRTVLCRGRCRAPAQTDPDEDEHLEVVLMTRERDRRRRSAGTRSTTPRRWPRGSHVREARVSGDDSLTRGRHA